MEHQQRSYLEHKNNIQLNRYIIYLLLVDNFIYVVIVMDRVPEISVRRQIGDAFLHILYQKRLRKSMFNFELIPGTHFTYTYIRSVTLILLVVF